MTITHTILQYQFYSDLVLATAIPTTIPGTPDGIIHIIRGIITSIHLIIISLHITIVIILIMVMEDITVDTIADIIIHIIKPDQVM